MNYITIESNVVHQFECYLQRLSCMIILCSLRTRGWIENRISILWFRRLPQKVSLRPLHVESFDCDE